LTGQQRGFHSCDRLTQNAWRVFGRQVSERRLGFSQALRHQLGEVLAGSVVDELQVLLQSEKEARGDVLRRVRAQRSCASQEFGCCCPPYVGVALSRQLAQQGGVSTCQHVRRRLGTDGSLEFQQRPPPGGPRQFWE